MRECNAKTSDSDTVLSETNCLGPSLFLSEGKKCDGQGRGTRCYTYRSRQGSWWCLCATSSLFQQHLLLALMQGGAQGSQGEVTSATAYAIFAPSFTHHLLHLCLMNRGLQIDALCTQCSKTTHSS